MLQKLSGLFARVGTGSTTLDTLWSMAVLTVIDLDQVM